MDKILSFVMFPFLGTCIMIAGIIVYECVIIKKHRHKKKIVHVKKVQQAKRYLIIFAIIEALCLSYTTYLSLDLIKKDFVVCEAEFVESDRIGRALIYSVRFKDGEKEYDLFANLNDSNFLKEGQRYIITYGKRTDRIIEIAETDSNDEQSSD